MDALVHHSRNGEWCVFIEIIMMMMPPIELQQRLLERANAERSEKLRYRGVSYVPTKAVVVDPEYFGKKI